MQIDLSDYVSGAALATELANSGSDVRQRLGELLVDPAALSEFLRRHRLGAPGGLEIPPPGERELREVYALRRRVVRILRAGSESDLVEASNALLGGVRGPYLGPDPAGGWRWYVDTSERASPSEQLAALIGVGLLGTLRTLGYERFRECAAPDCGGVFVDSSRAGRRRFCTPQICGNRMNVAQHRARRRTAVDREPEVDHLR